MENKFLKSILSVNIIGKSEDYDIFYSGIELSKFTENESDQMQEVSNVLYSQIREI